MAGQRSAAASLEVIPRKRIEYKDQAIERWTRRADARHPQIALVDELAHTNAPAAGIRALSRRRGTAVARHRRLQRVNIQHIESLTTLSPRSACAGARDRAGFGVRPRRPIELIDLTPATDQRLKEGKVYVPKQASAPRALLLAGNLTALRELALRRTAERVDEQLLTICRQRHCRPWRPASASWFASARIALGGAGAHHQAAADRLHAPWTAIRSRRRSLQLSDVERDAGRYAAAAERWAARRSPFPAPEAASPMT